MPAQVPVISPEVGKVIDLGDRTLLPGLIDAHVHLLLHPGAEDPQTVEESVPQRVILAAIAAKAGSDGGLYLRARHGDGGGGVGVDGGAQIDAD